MSTAANHSNDAMKKIDKFKQLLELEESISGICDLVSPTRELLKQGKVMKISARSGDHQERYLFIVSNCRYYRIISDCCLTQMSIVSFIIHLIFPELCHLLRDSTWQCRVFWYLGND